MTPPDISSAGLPPSPPSRRLLRSTRHGALLAAALFQTTLAGCAEPESRLVTESSKLVRIKGERPGAARLEGMGAIRGFGVGRDCTFMHCLELMLEAIGRKIGYDELMGISGMAFRLQFCVDPWDPGNPDPAVGATCLDVLFPAIGFEYDFRVVRREELSDAQALRDAIVKSVDRGVPVLAANIIPPEDWGIITGYERNGWAWKCRAYHGNAERVDRPARAWPTAVLMLTRTLPRPAPKPSHAKSIERAVQLFETRSYGTYALGRNAFEHWRQALEAAGTRRYIHTNAWTYYGLIDARGAAVRYLRGIANDFGSKKQHILEAARLFEQEVHLLRDGVENVPWLDQFPSSLPPADMRARQIGTLMRAKQLEERAIAQLKKAL